MTTVYDSHGVARHLGERVGRGGQGEIWALADEPDRLVKLYHPNSLRTGLTPMGKIACMTAFLDLVNDVRLAWPRMAVFNDAGQWIGYGMRRLNGFMFQTLCQPCLLQERLPRWDRSNLIVTALNFLDVVRDLHARAVIVGDINPANFLVDPATSAVGCLDCDSYQIAAADRFYPCPVGIPMYLAPELLAANNWAQSRRTIAHELFSVAIMLFRIFLVGGHPYNRVMGDDPVQNLKKGLTPLGKDAGCQFPTGPWYIIWSHLPFLIKSLFIRTFRQGNGYDAPEKRPTLDEWRNALAIYRDDMERGYHCRDIFPEEAKSPERRSRQKTRKRRKNHG